MKVFLNNAFIEQEEAKISVFDRGFLYGDGLFETIRFYKGEPFAWQEHIKRLRKALQHIRLDIPFSSEQLLSFSKRLIEINGLNDKDAYLRITVTRGVNKELRDFSSPCPTVFIYSKPIDIKAIRKKREIGIKAKLVAFNRGDFASLKHVGYLPSLVALMEVTDRDVEPIFTKGTKLLEGATSNLFFLKGEEIITPQKDILKGVMRDFFVKTFRNKSIKVHERDVFIKELKEFSGAFITNSILEIVPISQIDSETFNVHVVKNVINLFEAAKKGK